MGLTCPGPDDECLDAAPRPCQIAGMCGVWWCVPILFDCRQQVTLILFELVGQIAKYDSLLWGWGGSRSGSLMFMQGSLLRN
jgi:hypothetical protein